MLIRFRANSANQGWSGLSNALVAAATAAAGSTPATPSNCITWEVLDNTTAGGWTNISTNGPAEWATAATTGTFVHLVSDTIKTATDGYQKSFELVRNSVSTDTKYGGAFCRTGKITNGSPRITTASTLLAYVTGMHATAELRAWADHYYMNDHAYIISVTEQYLWLFQEWTDNPTDHLNNKIIGISDYTTGTEWDLTPGSLHFPVGGLYQWSTNATDSGYQNHRLYAYGIHNQAEAANSNFNDLSTWVTNYNSDDATSTSNSWTLPLGPYITNGTSTSNAYRFKSNWDAVGDTRLALQDIVFWNPLNGMSYRELHGMKIVGWDRMNSSYDTKRLHRKWLNANGVKYYLVEAGRAVYALSTV